MGVLVLRPEVLKLYALRKSTRPPRAALHTVSELAARGRLPSLRLSHRRAQPNALRPTQPRHAAVAARRILQLFRARLRAVLAQTSHSGIATSLTLDITASIAGATRRSRNFGCSSADAVTKSILSSL